MQAEPWKDYYRILRVDPSAEREIIEAAYKRLALMYHPDIDKSSDATRRFQEINEAFEVLRNPDKRVKYDRERTLGEQKHTEDIKNSASKDSQPKNGIPNDEKEENFWKTYKPTNEVSKKKQPPRNGISILIVILAIVFAYFALSGLRSVIDQVFATPYRIKTSTSQPQPTSTISPPIAIVFRTDADTSGTQVLKSSLGVTSEGIIQTFKELEGMEFRPAISLSDGQIRRAGFIHDEDDPRNIKSMVYFEGEPDGYKLCRASVLVMPRSKDDNDFMWTNFLAMAKLIEPNLDRRVFDWLNSGIFKAADAKDGNFNEYIVFNGIKITWDVKLDLETFTLIFESDCATDEIEAGILPSTTEYNFNKDLELSNRPVTSYNCVEWSQVSLSDVGKKMCVYGQLRKSRRDENALYLIFGKLNSDFYMVYYGEGWWENVEGQCILSEGVIKQLGGAPVIVVDDNDLSYCK